MNKRLLKTVTVLCLLCGFFVPVRVFADIQTYFVMAKNAADGEYSSDPTLKLYQYDYSGDTRGVILKNGSSYKLYMVSPDSTAKYYIEYTNSLLQLARSGSHIGNYYIYTYDAATWWNNMSKYMVENLEFPCVNTYWDYEQALYYTYGEGAVDPAPPAPDYGNLIDVRFNTDIAGSGTAAVNNIDHIKWNPDIDSNGISFDVSERVEIQAIPGNYTASSRNSLLSLGVTDFDYDSGSEHLLAELPVKNGEYTVSWSHVIQQLNAGSISDFLGIRKSSDTWLKSGWIYQIRLVAGEYTSEWKTIYNATSSGVENSLTVENSSELNMQLVNVIQSINTINSSQNENWTINNITINMENSDGQQTTEKPWWAYLLEAIVKAFGDILAFLGNLIGDLMNAITDLFKPAEFTINEYNDFKVEIKQNSGLFGQAIDFTNDLKNTFMGVQYQEPILHWQGISFDGIVFLPAADYNLNEYVEMWGLGDFRQIAYICSDGFIFFSLLLLIIRKLNEVLKK